MSLIIVSINEGLGHTCLLIKVIIELVWPEDDQHLSSCVPWSQNHAQKGMEKTNLNSSYTGLRWNENHSFVSQRFFGADKLNYWIRIIFWSMLDQGTKALEA